MKINYNLVFKDIINNIDKDNKPSLLLHVCCAPCSSSTLERLKDYFDITLYFYNPNMDTSIEYKKRYNEFNKLNDLADFKMVIEEYDHSEFLDYIKGLELEKEGGSRCSKCFCLRLAKSFNYAKINNYDYVGTTLTISPHKNSQMINSIAKVLEEKYNIKYLYSDFKKEDGYKKSIELSRKLDLYRQDYCGCEFSRKH